MKQSDNPAAHTLSDIMEGPPRKKWRQEPVACSLCRTKRLKCDRKTPCANCVARDVPCRSQIEVEDEQVMAKSTTIRNDAVSTNSKDASVLERLAYLERVVLGGQTQDATMMIDAPPRKKLDSISRGPQQSTNLRPPLHFHPWSVEASTDDLVVANQSLPSAFNVPIYDGSKELMQIPLPSYNDAQKILEVYSSKISPLQHVVDLEAAAAQMHAIYVAITQLEMPVLSHVALMLSMWAGATTVLPTQKFDHGHLTPAQAAEMTKFWTEKAFDILDILRRRSAIDLEVVQARDLLGFILFDTEAYTPRMAAGRLITYVSIVQSNDSRIRVCYKFTTGSWAAQNRCARSRSEHVTSRERAKTKAFLAYCNHRLVPEPITALSSIHSTNTL
jgi:hypothetical protein